MSRTVRAQRTDPAERWQEFADATLDHRPTSEQRILELLADTGDVMQRAELTSIANGAS